MKIRIDKKLALFSTLLMGVFVFFGLFMYYWNEVRDPYPDLTANAIEPYFPEFHFFIQQDLWRINVFQPIVADYYTRGGNNYLVGQYLTSSGPVEVEVFLTGQTSSKLVDSIAVYKDMAELEGFRYSFDDIQTKFPVGSQIPIYYIAEHPSDEEFIDNETFLQFFDEKLPVYKDSGYFDDDELIGKLYMSGVKERLYVK